MHFLGIFAIKKGYFDGYKLEWDPSPECIERVPEQKSGSYFLSRQKAISNEITKGGQHFYKLEKLHPDCFYHFSVKVETGVKIETENSSFFDTFNETLRVTDAVSTKGKTS